MIGRLSAPAFVLACMASGATGQWAPAGPLPDRRVTVEAGAAARERRRGAHRLQDRNQLRPPRRLGGRLRRRPRRRRLVRPARRRLGPRRPRPRAAAPALFEAFARLSPEPAPPLPPPPGALTVATAALPAPLRACRASGTEPGGGPEIAFPPDGARVDLGLARGSVTPLAIRLGAGAPPFRWLVDGGADPRRSLCPAGRMAARRQGPRRHRGHRRDRPRRPRHRLRRIASARPLRQSVAGRRLVPVRPRA